MKRILAAFLSMVMAFTVFACLPVSAEEDYPFSSAKDLEFGTPLTDNCADGTAYFRVDMPYSGKLYINFEHPYKSDGDVWYIEIYKKTGSGSYDIYTSDSVFLSDDELKSFAPIGAKAGEVFFVQVYADPEKSAASVNFKVSATTKKTSYFESEFNDDYKSADKLTLNKKLSGNCDNASKDYYYYKMPIDGTLDFKFYHQEIDDTDKWTVALYYKTKSGSYKKVETKKFKASGSSGTITVKKAVKGRTYYLVVSTGKYSSLKNEEYGIKPTVTLSKKPGKPSVSIKSKKKATIKWSKTSGVTGYQVQICKKSDFKKLTVDKKIKGKSKNKYTKTLSKNKTYYVRVRGYKKVGSKYYYSSWSSKKKFKTKK